MGEPPALYDPGGHAVHMSDEEAPARPLKVPAAHTAHTVDELAASVVLKVPGTHEVHDEDARVSLYVPA